MRMCNAESQKLSAKGSKFKDDDKALCYYSTVWQAGFNQQ